MAQTITVLGIDIAKLVFQRYGNDSPENGPLAVGRVN
jgi:hypothetical protein